MRELAGGVNGSSSFIFCVGGTGPIRSFLSFSTADATECFFAVSVVPALPAVPAHHAAILRIPSPSSVLLLRLLIARHLRLHPHPHSHSHAHAHRATPIPCWLLLLLLAHPAHPSLTGVEPREVREQARLDVPLRLLLRLVEVLHDRALGERVREGPAELRRVQRGRVLCAEGAEGACEWRRARGKGPAKEGRASGTCRIL